MVSGTVNGDGVDEELDDIIRCWALHVCIGRVSPAILASLSQTLDLDSNENDMYLDHEVLLLDK